MKKASKSVLAILLAALLLLGTGTAASAAGGKQGADRYLAAQDGIAVQEGENTLGTLHIETLGTAKAFVYINEEDGYSYLQYYDLSGLIVKAEGGLLEAAETVDYDTVTAEEYYEGIYDGKIIWSFRMNLDWDAQEEWQVGSNKALLTVWGRQYTNFTPVETHEGVEYGTFEYEEIFYGKLAVNMTGVKYEEGTAALDMDSARPLTLGKTETVDIPQSEQGQLWENTVFRFTPEEDGCYCFASEGARYGRWLLSRDGEERYFSGVDPWVELYDAEGNYLAYSDDTYTSNSAGCYYDFALYYNLEKGKTYYLLTSAYSYGSYTVTASKATQTLVATAQKVKIDYHERLNLRTLLEGTTWNPAQLSISYDDKVIWRDYSSYTDDEEYDRLAFYGAVPGTGPVTITAPNGDTVTIEVSVRLTAKQWLCVLFLGGFFWMRYTPVGEFSLTENLSQFFSRIRNGDMRYMLSTWIQDTFDVAEEGSLAFLNLFADLFDSLRTLF